MQRSGSTNEERVKKAIQRRPKPTSAKGAALLPSGSTMLNLALSDTLTGAFIPGTIVNVVGDSSSGKTLQSLFTLAAIGRAFPNYRLIHDDIETGEHFNLPALIGKDIADRIEPPRVDGDGLPWPSETIQDWRTTCVLA